MVNQHPPQAGRDRAKAFSVVAESRIPLAEWINLQSDIRETTRNKRRGGISSFGKGGKGRKRKSLETSSRFTSKISYLKSQLRLKEEEVLNVEYELKEVKNTMEERIKKLEEENDVLKNTIRKLKMRKPKPRKTLRGNQNTPKFSNSSTRKTKVAKNNSKSQVHKERENIDIFDETVEMIDDGLQKVKDNILLPAEKVMQKGGELFTNVVKSVQEGVDELVDAGFGDLLNDFDTPRSKTRRNPLQQRELPSSMRKVE